MQRDADYAFHAVIRCPALLAECKAKWQALSQAAREPAGNQGVTKVVASRFALFPQPDRTDSEWAAWWLAYFDALEDLPEEALELGMREYLRQPDAEFLPKPGKLRELARQASTPGARAAGLAARCAAYTPPRAEACHEGPIDLPKPRRMPTAEERKRDVAAAKEVCRKLAETAAKRERPTHNWRQPPTDEQGLTPAMRELIQRREGDGA